MIHFCILQAWAARHNSACHGFHTSVGPKPRGSAVETRAGRDEGNVANAEGDVGM